MKLVFDCETTGKYDFKADIMAPHQPHIVQLAAALYDDDGTRAARIDVIVKPDGYTIPQETSDIHGITTERAMAVGIPLAAALVPFRSYASITSVLVAHNIKFDFYVVGRAFMTLGIDPAFLRAPKCYCTMLESAGALKLPGFRGQYKWPKLIEAYRHFYGRDFENAHDALADVQACAAVYFALLGKPLKTQPEAPLPDIFGGVDRLSNGYSIMDLARCAHRETRMREKVFGARVHTGQMDAREAERETEMMRTIARLLDNHTMAELPLS